MTDQKQGGAGPFDPFATWQQWAKAGEEMWSRQFEAFVNTDQFARMLSQYLDSYLKSNEAMRGGVEQYLSAMNLPTRADLTRIAELIVGVDAKLDDLVQDLESRAPDARGEVAALTAKLDALSAAVSRLESRLDEAPARAESQRKRGPAARATEGA